MQMFRPFKGRWIRLKLSELQEYENLAILLYWTNLDWLSDWSKAQRPHTWDLANSQSGFVHYATLSQAGATEANRKDLARS